ncbi:MULTISPECIES: archease [unclassified Streptomyces]|uniref:archease n=1 Tax=unclassified Streptomyces TaxID=2593676 RepID=UPI000366D38B|nr:MULTISPECIES: archease [unclassified Streptomyces]MYT33130.1 archease [Streptomyces sp. SID8354]
MEWSEGSPLPGGHRSVPHTADLRVEAWGPTREVCLAQAVRGMCGSFLDLAGAVGVGRREAVLRADTDEDLLVALLEEVIYRIDTHDEVPVDLQLSVVRGGLRARLSMADLGALPVVGAAPKAVTLHGLTFTRGQGGGWQCSVTLDV